VAGDKKWPSRYATPPKTQGATLLDLWGYPEQPPALGHAVAMTRDGKQALYVGGGAVDADGMTDDSFLGLWDVTKAQLLREILIPKATVTALALSPDARFAAAGLAHVDGKGKESRRLVVWDLTTGAEIRTHVELASVVSAVAFAPDGKRILAAQE